jgi:hypothetical protein
VTDREKWKDIVRQAKAHSGLQCQWKKKKNEGNAGNKVELKSSTLPELFMQNTMHESLIV